jgi:hypothetical protein
MSEESRDSHLAGLVGASEDSDSSGRGQKHQAFSLRPHLGDGVHGVLYGKLAASAYMDEAQTLIELPFGGFWRTGEDGSEWQEGLRLAVIKGKRLEVVFSQICEGRRLSVKPTGKVDDAKKPEVEVVFVRRLED